MKAEAKIAIIMDNAFSSRGANIPGENSTKSMEHIMRVMVYRIKWRNGYSSRMFMSWPDMSGQLIDTTNPGNRMLETSKRKPY